MKAKEKKKGGKLPQKSRKGLIGPNMTREKYQFLFEQSPVLNLIIGSDGRIVDINEQYLSKLGYTKKEILGRPALELVVPGEREAVGAIIEEGFKGKFTPELEVNVRAKDNSTHTILFSPGQVLLYEGKRPAGILFTGLDITERKILDQHFSHLSRALNQLGEMVIITDLSHKITYVNQASEHILGYEPREIISRDSRDFFKDIPGNPPDLVQMIEESKAEDGWKGEIFNRKKGGSLIRIQLTLSWLKDENGEILGCVGVSRDITERKEAEEALRRREAILEAVSFAGERFLKTVSWEDDIQKVIEHLGSGADVGRVYIFENHYGENGELLTSQRYEWVAEGIEPQAGRADLHDFPWQGGGMERWEEKFSKNEVICGQVREFPESEQDILLPQDILSIVAVPIYIKRHWWGFIGFDECRRERQWTSAEVDALKTAAGIIGAVIERKKTEEALRESEERLEMAVTGTNLGMWDDNLVTGKVVHNRQYTDMLGYVPGEIGPEARFWEKLVHPDDLPQFLKARNEYLEGKTPLYEAEFRMRTKTGEWKWIQSVGRGFERDENGKPLRMIGTHRDITGRKKAEAALEQEKSKLEEHSHILNIMTGQMMDMVYYKDKNFRYLFSSKPHCERILKCSPEECIGLTDVEIAQRCRQAGHDQGFGEICFNSDRQTREGGKPSQFLETAKVDGEEISLEVYKTPLYDENGEFAGIVGCSRDITEQQRAEEDLKKHREHLEEIVKDRTAELQALVDAMSGREARMADLKDVIRLLRKQIEEAGMEPAADDPLLG